MKKVLCAVGAAVMFAATSVASAEAVGPVESLNAIQSTGIKLSDQEMMEVRGEGFPVLLYYAVLAAPTLTSLLNSALVNHFPVMLIRDAWKSIRG